MKKSILFLSVYLLVAGASPAFALTVDVWDASTDLAQINAWKSAQKGSVHVLEDFEDMGTGWYNQKETGVGTFTAVGPSGLGGSSYNSSNGAPYFSIQDSDTSWYGRSNTTASDDASQWLDSGDITLLTLAVKDDSLKNLFFYIQDPADSGGMTILFINHFLNYSIFANNQDKASFFVGITLTENETLSSLAWLTTSRSDGFGLDDFSTIHNPEPATMLLFGFGLIGIAGITRKFT
nr:PEP-CTERM sorting domain-containing protein [uncultured Desulfobacter sp.]